MNIMKKHSCLLMIASCFTMTYTQHDKQADYPHLLSIAIDSEGSWPATTFTIAQS